MSKKNNTYYGVVHRPREAKLMMIDCDTMQDFWELRPEDLAAFGLQEIPKAGNGKVEDGTLPESTVEVAPREVFLVRMTNAAEDAVIFNSLAAAHIHAERVFGARIPMTGPRAHWEGDALNGELVTIDRLPVQTLADLGIGDKEPL